MTEPGQNPENLEPTPSGSTETDANASENIGTAPSSDTGNDTAQQAMTPDESAQPEAALSTSIDESAQSAGTETPQPEQPSEQAETVVSSETQAGESVPPASPNVDEANASPSSADTTTENVTADNQDATSDTGSDENADATSDEADSDSGSQRRGPRGWQPPAMTEERMKEIWDELAAHKQSHEDVELEVVSKNRGGVVTQYKGVEVFVPMSHWTLDRHGSDPGDDAAIGNKVTAHVLEMTEFATDARRVTATRRSVLRNSVLESLEVGKQVSGRVSSILDFGIFVDLGGIDGLVHASEISHVRGRHPSELVRKGEEVEVVIKEIDRDKERIYLGMKELLASPWSNVEEKFPEGTMQTGKVVGMTKQGAFVELEPGLDGFIRLRELSWTKRVHHPKEVLRKGMDIEVKVLDVNERKQRLSLSYRQAQDDPWPAISEKYSVGTQWEGEIREISNKGVVVGIDEVEGFLPRGRMGRESKRLPEMKMGEKLTVNVIEVDPKNFSLIFGLPHPDRNDDEGGGGRGRGDRRDRRDDRGRQPAAPAPPKNELKSAETVTNFALGDMIGEELKKKLGMDTEQPAEQPAENTSASNVPSGDTASTTAPAENQEPPASVEQAAKQAEQAREHMSSEEAAAQADQLEKQAEESSEEGESVEVSSEGNEQAS